MSVKLSFAQAQVLRAIKKGSRKPEDHPASTISALLARGLLDKTRDERTGLPLLHVTERGEYFL